MAVKKQKNYEGYQKVFVSNKAKKETRVNDGMYPPLMHVYTLNDRLNRTVRHLGVQRNLSTEGSVF